jgi:hypothetical protein
MRSNANLRASLEAVVFMIPEFDRDAQFHRSEPKWTDASTNLPPMPNYELAAARHKQIPAPAFALRIRS